MTGQVIYLSWITRDMVRAEPNSIFVFGDNVQRIGMGGQAGAMRGERNAQGVATKVAPGMADADFYTDAEPEWLAVVAENLAEIARHLSTGKTVYVPRDGLGTGLSELPKRAPALANFITSFFRACPGEPCPWEFV